MNNAILRIDFGRLAVMLLPEMLRPPRIIALLGILVKPFAALLTTLTDFRTDKLQRLKYNGQVCKLEYCLNFRFGSRDNINDLTYPKRIRILDGTDSDGKPYIIYCREVNAVYDKPKQRGERNQIILNRRSVNNQRFYNFIVECPREYLSDKRGENIEKEFAAVVNTYKTQGKTWELRII